MIMNLPQYEKLEDKESYFDCETIDDITSMCNRIECLRKKNNLRFRGVCEAKYMMFSSLQRSCFPAGRQLMFDKELLQYVQRNDFVNQYFNRNNIRLNEITCLALMQHYGLPTPLIDFSLDIDVALYFASQTNNIGETGNIIDEYASLYYFDLDQEFDIKQSLQNIIYRDLERGFDLVEDFKKNEPIINLDTSRIESPGEFVTWDYIVRSGGFLFIEYQDVARAVNFKDGDNFDLSNPNSKKQKGCFVVNSYCDNVPLEKQWTLRTRQYREEIYRNADALPCRGIHTNSKLKCLNIRKELFEKWSNTFDDYCPYDNSRDSMILEEKLKKEFLNLIEQYRFILVAG